LAYTSHAKRLIEVASKEARETGSVLSAEHLLLAALHEPRGALVKILADAGVSADQAQAAMRLPAHTKAQPQRAEPAGGKRSISWRALLLLAVPLSVVLERVVHAPALAVFSIACLGVLPLAGYMGEANEHLAHRSGPTIGGLLNATFWNAAELIISIVALQAGLVGLVKASITGSILGNLLLILGLSRLLGGAAAMSSGLTGRMPE